MEYSIEAIAAMDSNGPRKIVDGWHPQTAQKVNVLWRWATTTLALIPFFQLGVLGCVVRWANRAIIRDSSDLSTARLLRPLVEQLGGRGCLLTGKEIAEELPDLRLKYGYRDPSGALEFENAIEGVGVRHVDLLEEHEGLGVQGDMPAGRYDGLSVEDERRLRRRSRPSMLPGPNGQLRRRLQRRLRKQRAKKLKPD